MSGISSPLQNSKGSRVEEEEKKTTKQGEAWPLLVESTSSRHRTRATTGLSAATRGRLPAVSLLKREHWQREAETDSHFPTHFQNERMTIFLFDAQAARMTCYTHCFAPST